MSDQTPRKRALKRRRRENAQTARTQRYSVYVTPEEAGRLARIAEAQHVTVPRLLAESAFALDEGENAMTRTERDALLASLFDLLGGLGRIGNNLNQIARVANATGEINPEELSETLQVVLRGMRRVDETIDEVSRP